jgi:MscS family membrane protein
VSKPGLPEIYQRVFVIGLAAGVIAASGLLLAAAPSAAQQGGAASAVQGAANGEPQPVLEDAYNRGTPRGAAKGFLDAAREDDWAKAANYLDTRRVPGDPAELARQLRLVLKRTMFIDLDALANSADGKRGDGLSDDRDKVGTINTDSNGAIDVLLQRVPREDGQGVWKFAAVTVAQVTPLHAQYGRGPLEQYLPDVFFEFEFMDLALWQWAAILLLVVLAWILSWFITYGILRTVGKLVARTATRLDDHAFDIATAPARLAIGLLIFRVGLTPLSLDPTAIHFTGVVLRALLIVTAAWVGSRVVDVLTNVVQDTLVARGMGSALGLVPPGRKLVKIVVAVVAAIAVLDTFDFNVTALVAGLGVGGIAVALAAQKTIENLFGGLTLYADRPVRVGDFCKWDEKVGTVEEIGVRSTRIRTLDRTVISVPNADFAAAQIENFTKRDRIRLTTVIGLRYETSPEQLRWTLVEIRKLLYSHERVLPDPARIRFVGFGAYSLDLEVLAYVNTSDWNEFLEIREDIYLRIMDIVNASGSGFAFPSQTLYLGKDDGLDAERIAAAESDVRAWRENRELYLPRFPPEKIQEIAGDITYPPRGSPDDTR